MKHLIVLPYYHHEEIKRYLHTALFLRHFTETNLQFEFLLCSRNDIADDKSLLNAFSQIASVNTFHCQNLHTGHPEGSNGMFWEIMEHVNSNYQNDGGFALWLEPDMVPIKKDWLDRLHAEWVKLPIPILMGRHLKLRLFPAKINDKKIYTDHINGGACYAKNFAQYIPPAGSRIDCKTENGLAIAFDVQHFPAVKKTGLFRNSKSFAFVNSHKILSSISNPNKVILHAYGHDKDEVVTTCVKSALHATNNGKFYFPETVEWFYPSALMQLYFDAIVRRARHCLGWKHGYFGKIKMLVSKTATHS